MKYICIYHDAYAANGPFPQIEGLQEGYSVSSPTSIAAIAKFRGSKVEEVELFLKLSKGATLTDILSTSYFSERTGLLISRKFLDLISDYLLPPYQVFPASVQMDNSFIEYYYVHFMAQLDNLVNFSRSPFRILDPQNSINKIIYVHDDKEYRQLLKSSGILATINMTEVNLFDYKYDVVNLPYLFTGLLVSQPLFDEMIQRKITGFSVYQLLAQSEESDDSK
jgi:hypothetical protein